MPVVDGRGHLAACCYVICVICVANSLCVCMCGRVGGLSVCVSTCAYLPFMNVTREGISHGVVVYLTEMAR